jgi:hypothetical protein
MPYCTVTVCSPIDTFEQCVVPKANTAVLLTLILLTGVWRHLKDINVLSLAVNKTAFVPPEE